MKIRKLIHAWGTILLFFLILPFFSYGSVYINVQQPANIVDTLKETPDTLGIPDTLKIMERQGKRKGVRMPGTMPDTTAASATDTITTQDTTFTIRISKDTLEAEVIYSAEDSIIYDISGQKIYLYGNADVKYDAINLKAHFIEYDWKNSLLTAEGKIDSLGFQQGRPEFIEGDRTYRANRFVYNFKSKKGKIYDLITQEGEGFIHSEEVKKDEVNNLYAARAKYTTCNLDHPHFWIEADPLKIIPNELLVCGPTNLVIEGVRTPLVLPFAIFPIKQGQRSGILPPEISNSSQFGFGLLNGGYYFGISDNYDLQLRSSIYSSGSWRLEGITNFIKRYRYSGNLSVSVGSFTQGNILFNNLQQNRDFKINGSYRVDPKAWPNNNLSASINIATSQYDKYNSYDYNNRFNNFYQSSINYSRHWPGKPFSLSAGLGHSQNTSTRIVNIRAPELNFSVSKVNPFERKIRVGAPRWYEDIGFRYTMNARNSLEVVDSMLFRPGILGEFRSGVQHQVPVQTSLKLFKYFTVTPSVNYTENWYFESIDKVYDPQLEDTIVTYVRTDTFQGFNATRYYRSDLAVNTRLYGRVNFRNSKVKAIRHVLSPTVTFSYQPDFGAIERGYYDTVTINPQGDVQTYYRYPTDLFGAVPVGRQGGVGLSLNNNLEMKVFSAKDTVNQERKIKILESFNISTFYNLAADSLNLSPIRINGRTTLFEKVSIDFNTSLDPYITDEDGFRRLNRFEWTENGRIARFTDANMSFSANFGSRLKESRRTDYVNSFRYPNEPINYIEYNVPWSFSTRYNLRLNRGTLENPDSLVFSQSLGVDVNLNLTPQWRISLASDYDIVQKKFMYANIEVYRDLHCWEMRFRWIPFGTLKSYSFGINVKSAVLKDLKIEKKNNPLDNYTF